MARRNFEGAAQSALVDVSFQSWREEVRRQARLSRISYEIRRDGAA
jgi:hypothetical protein